MNSVLIDCPSDSRTPVTLMVNPVPTVPEDINTFLCEGESITINASVDDVDYLWNTGETTRLIDIMEPGEYTVIVTDDNGCSNMRSFFIDQIDLPIIQSITSDGPSILVLLSNTGDFEYSLDQTTYQDSSFFEAVTGGNYTIFVRDKQGCSVVTQEYLHVVIPKFFTPNGDSVHDVFIAEGVDTFTTNELFIFDRFGKLLKNGSQDSAFWDGTLNGQELPAGNYWYKIIVDNSTFTGAFALKR